MPKELTKLIWDMNKMNSVNERIDLTDFVIRFKNGIEEEPEKMEELINTFNGLMKKDFPDMPLSKIWILTLKNVVKYCFMADNNQIELNRKLKLDPVMMDYLLDPMRYGPTTKALSNYLKCEGDTLILKIWYGHGLN